MEYRLRAPSAQRFLMALSKMTQGDIERSFSLPEVCSRAKLPEDEVGEFKSEVLGWLQRDGMIILKDDRVKITNSGIFASQGS